MFQDHRLHFPLWRPAVLTIAVSTVALLFPRVAHPQEPVTRISCSSDGGRVFCDADTKGGVRLQRHYLDSGACVEGTSWGYTERGIWVDRGCAGQFALLGAGAPQGSISRLTPGTVVSVRTKGLIDAQRFGGVYEGTVADDVFDGYGHVAIPRGSLVQIKVRENRDGDMALGLDSVVVNGQPYTLRAGSATMGQGFSPTPGEEILVRGPRLHVPPDTRLTFQID